MVDNEAPYIAISLSNLCALADYLLQNWCDTLDAVPAAFSDCPYWQYRSGSRASEVHAILGSVFLVAFAPDSTSLRIRHLVLDGESQCVIGRDVTSRAGIFQLGLSFLQTIGPVRQTICITLTERQNHLCLPLFRFVRAHVTAFTDTASQQYSLDWTQTRAIVDRAHRHVCGHST